MFLDCLLRDYFAAMHLLIRRANDDYGIDKWPERFPGKFERTADPGLTRVMGAPLWELGFLNAIGPRVEESGLGLIAYHPYSAPYEDLKLRK